ncbi:sigma E protease regulator RseP [Corallincola holothuriorum]|uniref:Zinc metalloprotease n=1 Tax=Corallincola holothuriorum TaxID=2282215 RepID=A0A368NG36_9GAMM|nr:sigma E protease regulator RseP [Corallincola holothuriorum]RCU48873.1 sigma E protease regulator RseP [Corallincola holothuriorum]
MFDILWNICAFIFALGILITFHEYGHFWVARRCGVKVLKFSIGFGKPLWSKVSKSGTEYVLAAIPLGGYVRMLDGRVDDVPSEQKHLAFDSKPVSQRIAIVSAGPLANFVFAILAYWLMFGIGVPSVKPVIGEVMPESIAAEAGFEPGMQIIEIAGRQTLDWEEVSLALVAHIGNETIPIKLNSASSGVSHKSLDIRTWQFDPDQQPLLSSLGIKPFFPTVTLELAHVEETGAGAQGGLEVGDLVIAADSELIESWPQLASIIAVHGGEELIVDVMRDGAPVTLVLMPSEKASGDGSIGYLGIAPRVDEWPDEYRFEMQYSFVDAFVKGVEKTGQLIVLSIDMIGKLLTGDVSVKNLSGPISIAQGAGSSAGYGLVYFLGFLALISVNLGVINLLPLPVLDGGHLVYYIVELIRGKPVSERIQEVGFRVGSVLLLVIMGIAIFNDVARL